MARKSQIDLAELDALFQTHLPLGPETLLAILEPPNARSRRAPKAEGQAENLPHELLRTLRKVFAPLQGSSRALNEWAIPLRTWLATIYGEREVDDSAREGRILIAALKGLNQSLGELAEVPQSVAPIVNAADAIRCAVKRMSEEVVPPEARDDAVELLGWLELPLDDTPAAIVTSINEGSCRRV